jgi:thiopeptide-type bacteriocin biosynthesis protein
MIYHTCEKLVSDNVAQKYFFIRYADPESHIRLRVQAKENGIATLFLTLNNWINELYTTGIISKVVIDSYIREAERYGGANLIDCAEEYFYHDSKLVMSLLTMQRYGNQNLNLDYIGISFIISVFEAFGLSMEEQEQFLSSVANRKNYRKEFQNNRQTIMRAVDSSDDWFDIRPYISAPNVYDLINANKQELSKYAQAIFDSDQCGELTSTVSSIVRSVIHMFCNRLMGNNTWEGKIYSLTLHGVHGLRGYLKHNNKASSVVELPDSLI